MGSKRKRRRPSEGSYHDYATGKRLYASPDLIRSRASAYNRSESLEAPTSTTTINRAVEHAVRTLPPPSHLTSHERKTWRELTRTAAASVATSSVKQSDKSHTAPEPQSRVHTEVTKSSRVVDESVSRDWATTKLLSRPQRSWHVEVEDGISTLSKVPTRLNVNSGLATSKATDRSSRSRASSDADPNTLSQTERLQNHTSRAPPPLGFNTWRNDGTRDLHEVQHKARKDDGNLFSLPPRAKVSDCSFQNSSFGQKATSVPLYSGDTDTASAFKRFTAFLRARDNDSSEDESDASAADRDVQVAPADRGAPSMVKENSPPRSSDVDLTSVMRDSESSHVFSANTSGLVVAKEAIASTHDDNLPSFTQSSARSTPPIKANVGIKRQVVPEHIMRISSSEGTPDRRDAPTQSCTPLVDLNETLYDSDQDSEDVLHTIDEVSRNIFTATRPLPASKLLSSPDPRHKDLEDRKLTYASSNRRVTRSMLTPKKAWEDYKTTDVPFQEPISVICNSVRVPDTLLPNPQADEQMHLKSAAVEMSANSILETQTLFQEDSSSSLSELSRSPSPPPLMQSSAVASHVDSPQAQQTQETTTDLAEDVQEEALSSKRKRRMTGMTSRHFTPEKRALRKRQSAKTNDESNNAGNGEEFDSEIILPEDIAGSEPKPATPPVSASTRSSTVKTRKGTGRKSSYFTPSKPPLDPDVIDRVDFYNSTGKKKRVPAGVSTAPVPPISSAHFGIIQEKLWKEPFWLLIAVTFLNKTAGRAAAPVFWELKKRYPTPEQLANAKLEDLHTLIWHLGLQRQRSKRLIAIATAWVDSPPQKGKRWRTLHYPVAGDGKIYKQADCIEEDSEECAGALEIGHIPGCGPYAWDSWRIFCRDILRGVAEDYHGKGTDDEFEPEWRKVLPLDKELRACLRWMWLRDGWIWNHETGEKRRATAEEMELAERGEMEVADEQEKKFAAQAAGVEHEESIIDLAVASSASLDGNTNTVGKKEAWTPEAEHRYIDGDNILVSPATKAVRRSARLTA